MKKNFKFMLVALFALFGLTSAMAAPLKGTTQYGPDGFKYKILTIKKAGGGDYTVSVSQNVYKDFGAASIVIPNTITINVKGETDDSTPISIDEPITFKITQIEKDGFKGVTKGKDNVDVTSIQIGANVNFVGASAFEGCSNVTSINFNVNQNDVDIKDDAFKGTKPTTLDLTNLEKTTTVNKWFGTTYSYPLPAGKYINNTLTSVTFPAKLETIVPKAFAGFTALTTVTFPEDKLAAGTYLTIGDEAFSETPIVDLDLTNAKIQILNQLFEYNNVTLKTVKMSKSVEQLIGWDGTPGSKRYGALADCIQLKSVDFSKSTKLQTIGDGALSNTIVSEYDFTNCYTLTAAGYYDTYLNFTTTANPFVNEITTTNKNLETVKLPYKGVKNKTDYSPVTTIGTTFANCEVLTNIQKFEESKVTTVPDGAFANDKSLTSLEFPDALTTVEDSPFVGCEILKELTFNNQNAAALTIGDGANIYGTTLDALTTLNINTPSGKEANVTIYDGALVGCTGITTLNVAKGGKFVGKIKTFALNEKENATITIGDIDTGASFEMLTGPKGIYTTELTTGSVNVGFTNAIVNGIVSKATVGQIKNGSVLTAIGQAKEIKFTGEVTVALNAPAAKNDALTTIDFGAVVIPAGNISAKVFDENNAPNLTDVTWKPANDKATKAFDQKAFGTDAKGAAAKVTLHTTTKVADKEGAYIGYELKETNLFNVIFDAKPYVGEPDEIEVYNAVATGFFYGKMQAAAKVAINKTNEDGDQVDVYSAFVDAKDQKIYMDRLATINGKYVIENGQVVIVRVKNPTTTTAHAKVDGAFTAKVAYAPEATLYPTMRYHYDPDLATYTIYNNLQMTDKVFSSDYIGTNYVGKTLYAMANPAIVGGLQFDPVAKTSYLPMGAVFVETDEAAPSRLDVIWLDDAEDATAIINTIESRDSKAGNGKIYNLQGIEVDGSYKGIVIVNGKKISQK